MKQSNNQTERRSPQLIHKVVEAKQLTVCLDRYEWRKATLADVPARRSIVGYETPLLDRISVVLRLQACLERRPNFAALQRQRFSGSDGQLLDSRRRGDHSTAGEGFSVADFADSDLLVSPQQSQQQQQQQAASQGFNPTPTRANLSGYGGDLLSGYDDALFGSAAWDDYQGGGDGSEKEALLPLELWPGAGRVRAEALLPATPAPPRRLRRLRRRSRRRP